MNLAAVFPLLLSAASVQLLCSPIGANIQSFNQPMYFCCLLYIGWCKCLQAEGQEQDLGCSPMHACWSGLLQRMLSAGLTESVLRCLDGAVPTAALLTPQEAHQLVEHCKSLAQPGIIILLLMTCMLWRFQVCTASVHASEVSKKLSRCIERQSVAPK